MASAIVKGIISTQNDVEIILFDKNPEVYKALDEYQIRKTQDSGDLIGASDILFLCVKPQDIDAALADIKGKICNEQILVSIVTGISTGYIMNKLDSNCKVIRTMPNTPMLISHGAVAAAYNPPVTEDDYGLVRKILQPIATVEVLPEDKMNEVTCVNASSPAYIYLFAKTVVEEAEEQGIDPEKALNLFASTLIGAGKMLIETEKTPSELIDIVQSPNGTTEKAMDVLKSRGFSDTIREAMRACTKRAIELGK